MFFLFLNASYFGMEFIFGDLESQKFLVPLWFDSKLLLENFNKSEKVGSSSSERNLIIGEIERRTCHQVGRCQSSDSIDFSTLKPQQSFC